MRKVANFCDFFVICSGSSQRRVKAIAQSVIEGLEKSHIKIHHTEGQQQANWIVIDLGDILVHIFDTDTRSFYNLEHLWQDAVKIEYNKKSEN
jgi:ribosome-associated protein